MTEDQLFELMREIDPETKRVPIGIMRLVVKLEERIRAQLAAPAPSEPVYCGCGDQIMPDDGARCGTCVSIKYTPTPSERQSVESWPVCAKLSCCGPAARDSLFCLAHRDE